VQLNSVKGWLHSKRLVTGKTGSLTPGVGDTELGTAEM